MADDNLDDNAIAIEAKRRSETRGNSSSNHLSNHSNSSIQSLLYHATLEEFEQMFQMFNIAADLKTKSRNLLQDIFDADIFHTDPKMSNSEIFASIVYLTVIDARVPYGISGSNFTTNATTVTDILSKANVNINDLFRALLVINEKISFSEGTQQHFIDMKKKYCVLSAIYHTFKSRLCSAVFREDTKKSSEDSLLPPIPETEGLSYRKKLAWVLFLLAKRKMLQGSVELFQHFQLLLCCLEYVLRNTPSFLLNYPYDSIRFGCYTEEEKPTMLEQLANDFQVDFEDTQALQDNNTEPFFQKLSNCDGELDCDKLCEEYMKHFKKEGDLNELLFLSKNSLLAPLQSPRMTINPNNGYTSSPQAMTPVRVAVSAVQQLHLDLSGVKEEPGSKLTPFYNKCEPDLSMTIGHLVSDLKERFMTRHHSVNGLGVRSTVGAQRWSLGIRLYQKVLENMIVTESERLPQATLSVLLSMEEFHKSMIACSLEVVLATYGQSLNQSSDKLVADTTSCAFPWILDVFDLQAYDFYKVVESFIKAEPKLSRDVVKHLQSIEFQTLDSLAWKEGSTLFDALSRCDNILVSAALFSSPIKTPVAGMAIQSQGPGSETSKCSVELFLSPARPKSSIIPPSSQSSSPIKNECPDAGGGRQPAAPKSQSLTHFFSRVSRLGFYRLTKLCNALVISKDLEHKIWTCFEHCITKMPGLLKNRHLDQILMCCIYGICKVTEHELLFKAIVNQYKTLSHSRQEIYKNVYIRQEDFDTIIGFYNRVFIQNMEMYIKQFSLASNKTPPLSPKPKQAVPSPTYSLPCKKNFYVSPLKPSPFKPPASPSQLPPSSRMLYSFGETLGSSEKLSMINEKMSAVKKRKMSVNKCLNFDAYRTNWMLKGSRKEKKYNIHPSGHYMSLVTKRSTKVSLLQNWLDL